MSGNVAYYILDKNNEIQEEPDVIKWSDWLNQNKYIKTVTFKDKGETIVVHTAFLGFYNFMGNIFETQIFGGAHDGACQRNNTYAGAMKDFENYSKLALEPKYDLKYSEDRSTQAMLDEDRQALRSEKLERENYYKSKREDMI